MMAEAENGLAESPSFRARTWRILSSPAARAAAKIAVSAGLLFLIFRKVQMSEPSMRIGGGDWGPILFVWLMQTILPFVQAQRWRLIAAALEARLPYVSAVSNVYVGQFFNQLLPSSVGGDAVRVWKLTRIMPLQTALSSVALDRVMALVAVPIILLLGSGLLLRIVPAGPFRWSLFAMIALAGCGLLLLFTADRVPLPGAIIDSRVVSALRGIPPAARRLFSNPGCFFRALFLSIVIHLGVGTSLWILAENAGADAPLAAFLLLAPLIAMVTTVPISVGGWGVREGAMITALSLVDIPPSVALTVSIQFGLIMLVVGLPGGLITLFGVTPRTQQG